MSGGGEPRAWVFAARIVARWLGARERVDRLMEGVPSGWTSSERARCQHLVYGALRHAGRIEAAIGRHVAHNPRAETRAVLYLASFELIEAGGGDGPPKIVHHAVERARELASPAEARLVNAVARKLAADLGSQGAPPPGAPSEALAEYYSHPEWLVRRWLGVHGAEATRALLEWNQRPAPIYARLRPGGPPPEPGGPLVPTRWPEFFEVAQGRWPEIEPLLKSGRIYIQDPSTLLPVRLLAPAAGETVLDLCASPGGKALAIADALASAGAPPGRLVALDLPGERILRLKENLALARGVEVAIVEGDLLRGAGSRFTRQGLPAAFPAVLIDVPCSNTGVMRHRIDVKWRLREGDFGRLAVRQALLLNAAASLVAPGGRLVYSTCSLDPEENEGVVAAFLERSGARFERAGQDLSHPRASGSDGGGAFLLRRKGSGRGN